MSLASYQAALSRIVIFFIWTNEMHIPIDESSHHVLADDSIGNPSSNLLQWLFMPLSKVTPKSLYCQF